MKKELFRGCGTAIITPFDHDERIDFETLEKLISWQIDQGADALIVAGTTGEAPALSDDEFLALVNFSVCRAAGRIPIIAGTGRNNTHHTLALSSAAQELGVDGLLIVNPYYNKSTQQGLVSHFTYIADRVSVPILLYNVPSRTGMSFTAETYKRLSMHENIVGVKEASGDMGLIGRTRNLCPDSFAIYSGNDDQILPVLSLGGAGVISVLSNIAPRPVHDICQSFFEGKTTLAADMQTGYIPLIDALFCETSPIPVKAAMKMMGLDKGVLRLPLVPMSPSGQHRLRNELVSAGLIVE